MPPRRSKLRPSEDEEAQLPVVEDNDVEMEDANTAEDEDEEGGIRIGDIYLPPPPLPACTFDYNGPRLIITHIENEFFKSYAGKQVLGPFHKSFTSIVGPNGSGKSNVIDSMLFVFGYRAQKIRSKKISVLIHNSENYPNVQSCTVAVYFQRIIDGAGDDEFTVVPNSQFCVSRVAFKDNSSFYKLDGKRCQFKVVSRRLRQEGIDLDHNRFLILQGEVEQIAMMKPKAQTEHDTGMLEYLEDIVGSSRFKDPIELLYKRVEELNEQRGEKLNRVKLVEKEKDELEEPKNEAVSYIKLENDIVCRKNVLYQRYVLDCTRLKEKAEQKKKEVDEKMHDIKEKLAKIEELRKVKENESKDKREQMENIVKNKEELNEKFKALESKDVQLQEELKHKNQKRKKLMIQLKTDKEKLVELEKVPTQNEKDIEECKTQRKHLEVQFKKEEEIYHKAMASLNTETQQLQDEKEKLETELIDLRKEVDDTKSALDIAQSELDIYLSTEKNEKRKLDQIKASIDKATAGLAHSKEEVATLTARIPEYKNQESNNKVAYASIAPQLAEKEKRLASARVSLEETSSSMSHSKRGETLDVIMKEKETGRIPGIYGRLGDLGGIDEKYDVAISTACGPLDNIVVDTIDTAQKCIKILKDKRKGIATFIALDKITRDWKRESEQRRSFPENVNRLFDLVRVKDINVKPAFYFALRDTLVADDLEQASRIGLGQVRRRVVTLKGELIEPAGTMSGGGKYVSRGRMGKSATIVNVDPNKVVRDRALVDQLTAEIGDLRRQKVSLENDMQTVSRDLKTMEINYKKHSREVESLDQQSNTLTKQLESQKQKVEACRPEKDKVAEMEKNISAKLKKYEKAASAAQAIEEQVNKIHSQIMEITGGKIKGMKKKIDGINKSLEKLTTEITRLQVASKTAQRNSKKTEEKITSAETEIKEVESELLQYKDKKQAIEEEAAGILENLKAINNEEAQLHGELEEMKKSFDDVAQKENEVKSSKIEFDQEIEKYEGILKENKSKISHWEKQLKKLKLQEVPVGSDENEPTELLQLDVNHLEELDPKHLQGQLTSLEDKLAQSRPNLAVLQEYKKKEQVYFQRVAELEEITKSRDEQRKFHEDLRKQRLNEFMAGFTIISNKLKEMYQMITLGGDAELELVDSLDPFSEGIVFSVRPPKKSWKNITNLSGGEKTLSSLALVFALHYYKPTPLYVMDEIDAALDFKNVSIVGNYIKERTKNAQFIIISLRSQMFELADRLVGIFKTYNCTKSVTINPGNYTAPQKENVLPKEKELLSSPRQSLLNSQSLAS